MNYYELSRVLCVNKFSDAREFRNMDMCKVYADLRASVLHDTVDLRSRQRKLVRSSMLITM